MNNRGPAVIVVTLLAATGIAFAVAERQKLAKPPFSVVRVTRDFSPPLSAATIELALPRPYFLTLGMVNARGRVVDTLARNQRFGRGNVIWQWRGRGIVDGVYEPKVTVDRSHVFNLPNPVRADSTPPRITLVSISHLVIRAAREAAAHHVEENVSPLADSVSNVGPKTPAVIARIR